jgi:hypothetical protein
VLHDNHVPFVETQLRKSVRHGKVHDVEIHMERGQGHRAWNATRINTPNKAGLDRK